MFDLILSLSINYSNVKRRRISVECYLFLNYRCLDSIIHAEHKVILEEMRRDYSLTQSPLESKGNETSSPTTSEEVGGPNQKPSSEEKPSDGENIEQDMPEKEENDKSLPFHYGLDLGFLLDLYFKNSKRNSAGQSRFVADTVMKCFLFFFFLGLKIMF